MNDQTPPSVPPGSTGPHTGSTAPPPGNRFFAWLRALELPRQPGWLGGVAAGIAVRLRIDPIIVRGILVVVALFGAPVLLVYAAAWLLLPDHTGRIHAEDLGRGRFNPALAGIAVMTLLGLWPGNVIGFVSGNGFFFGNIFGNGWSLLAFLWSLAVAAAAVIVVIAIARRSSAGGPAGPVPPSAGATWAAPADGSGAAPTAAATPGADAAASASTGTTATATDTTPTTVLPTAGAPGTGAPDTDASPPAGADAQQLADWHEQQARFKQERDDFVRNEAWQHQQAEAAARAAEGRRLRDERYAEYRAERQRTRSRPMFTLAAIGLALLAGAAVMLAVGRGALPLNAVVAGLATMLVALGLAIVVNGIMGRRSGGSSGMAWVVAAALVIVSTLSIGARVTFVGAVDQQLSYRDNSNATYLIGAGQTELDLRDYWEDSRNTEWAYGQVQVINGAGDVTITLPDESWVNLELTVGTGQIVIDDASPGTIDGRRGWSEIVPRGFDPEEFYRENDRLVDPVSPPPQLSVRIVLGAGDVTIKTEGELR